jgi:hypothetical protein
VAFRRAVFDPALAPSATKADEGFGVCLENIEADRPLDTLPVANTDRIAQTF